MRDKGRLVGVGALVLTFALTSILAVVEHRHRNPEWKRYQQTGIELAIQGLERAIVGEPSDRKRSELLSQVASLRNKPLEIGEISPFGGKLPVERCITCHYGIEDLSSSHPNSVFGCVICHGGNPADLTVTGAHRGLRGGKNPASLDLAPVSCGSNTSAAGLCHSDRAQPLLNRVETVPRSLMATNAGIIGILRFQWGLDKDSLSRFGIAAVSDGRTSLKPLPTEMGDDGRLNLAAGHFRKFCATCHLWSSRHRGKMGRFEGCPACHASYGEDGTYKGGDPTINRTEPGHAALHTITNRISDDRCRACHNRSARIGLNYHGEMESDQYGTPFVRGGLNDDSLGDGRFVLRLVPDIHREKGMGCVDCHTGQDTMGDSTLHRYMKDQIEIRCEDCHGTYDAPPKTMKVDENDPVLQTLMRVSPHLKLSNGDTILQTSKGRPLLHVRLTDKGFRLTGKVSGKEHPVTVITGTKKGHQIQGHSRMECDSCHSAWSPQCYGCHQLLDFRQQGLDHIAGKTGNGRWVEGRSFFRFERQIYGINPRGRVGILVPGCQVWNTVVDSEGKVKNRYDSAIMTLKNGLSSMAMGATHPHTTRREVPRCVDCHLDAKAVGLGEGRMLRTGGKKRLSPEPIYDSAGSGLKIPFPIDAVVDAQGRILQGTSHEPARGFNKEELDKIIGIGRCLACHDRYNDTVWDRSGPYTEHSACLKALERMGK
jgi:hypothetical protein